MTLDRKCSSGLQTIAIAAQRIMAGEAGIYVAGGVDSVSLVLPNKNLKHYHSDWVKANQPDLMLPMIDTSENVSNRYGITREMQDEYGWQSQMRISAAHAAGRLDAEIVPITVTKKISIILWKISLRGSHTPRKFSSIRSQLTHQNFKKSGTRKFIVSHEYDLIVFLNSEGHVIQNLYTINGFTESFYP